MSVEGKFLFRNSLAVAAKLFLPLMEALLVAASGSASMSGAMHEQFVGEMVRLKATGFDALMEGRAEKAKVVNAGGVGVVDGKPVFGPPEPEDDIPTGVTFAVGLVCRPCIACLRGDRVLVRDGMASPGACEGHQGMEALLQFDRFRGQAFSENMPSRRECQ